MSTALVELPPMGNLTPEQVSQKSLTHWIWTPYMDINNMQAWGLKSLLGYRGKAWELFKRCTPYPLGNMTQEDTDRAVVAEAHAAGFSIDPKNIPTIEYVKYAQDMANELGESYADEHGLRVLVPLIGMDDAERVGQIVQTVQPFAYAIYEMVGYEFLDGARKRIENSNLSSNDMDKADSLRQIMLNGARQAEKKAEQEYEILITSMSNASVGKEGISNPNEFHRWICEMLNRPVPERINRMTQTPQSVDNETVRILLERDAAREKELNELKALMAQSQGVEATEGKAKRKAKEA